MNAGLFSVPRGLATSLALFALFQPLLLARAQEESALLELARSELGLARCELVALDLPSAPGPRVAAELRLEGRAYTLELLPASQRAPGFRVRVDEGGGRLREVAPPPVTTWRGKVRERAESSVAGSCVDGRWTLQVRLSDEELWYLEPLSVLGPAAASHEYLAYRGRDVLPDGHGCGGAPAPFGRRVEQGGGYAFGPGDPLALAEIAFDADYEYYDANGRSVPATVADIEGVMNAVNAIYTRDVDIAHLFTDIVVRSTSTDPYTQSDPQALLQELTDEWNQNQTGTPRDVVHLMTGRDLDGTTVGIAWVGVLCSPTHAYGLSQSRYTSNWSRRVGLTSHELGHNWSACHCNQSPPGCTGTSSTCCATSSDCRIMCSQIAGCSGDPGSFAALAVQAIEEYRLAATCLGGGGRLYVDRDATGYENGLTWTSAFRELADALPFAEPGDEVWVAEGAYTPDPGGTDRDATFSLPWGAAVYGGFAGTETQRDQRDPLAHPTVLSGELAPGVHSYHVVSALGAGAGSVLDGFTVRGGRANGSGLRAAGAGLLIEGGAPEIRGVTFTDNVAAVDGGAIYCYFAADPRVEDCTFEGNAAANGGGAVMQRGTQGGTYARCRFHANTARYGGALYVDQARGLFADCLFSANVAVDGSGGASFGGAAVTVVADFYDGPAFAGCTFHGNAAAGSTQSLGGGIHASKFGFSGTALEMHNCILWGNTQGSTLPGSAQLHAASGSASMYLVDHCCVQDGLAWLPGATILTADPLFTAPALGDFTLGGASPCIDAGDDARVPAGSTLDLGGLPRIADGDSDGQATVDLGAHERAPDCNGNGVPDADDIALGTSTDLDANGVPDECEVIATALCACPSPLGPCGNDDASAGCANSTGAGAELAASGTSSVAADDLVLFAAPLPAGQFALYYLGAQGTSLPFGDGLRCIGGSTARFYPLLNSGPGGSVTLGPGIVAHTQASFPASHQIAPLSTWHFQCWYRDPQGPCASGFNLTNSLAVTFSP